MSDPSQQTQDIPVPQSKGPQQPTPFHCRPCGRYFVDHAGFWMHITARHPGQAMVPAGAPAPAPAPKPIWCGPCGRSFTSQAALTMHLACSGVHGSMQPPVRPSHVARGPLPPHTPQRYQGDWRPPYNAPRGPSAAQPKERPSPVSSGSGKKGHNANQVIVARFDRSGKASKVWDSDWMQAKSRPASSGALPARDAATGRKAPPSAFSATPPLTAAKGTTPAQMVRGFVDPRETEDAPSEEPDNSDEKSRAGEEKESPRSDLISLMGSDKGEQTGETAVVPNEQPATQAVKMEQQLSPALTPSFKHGDQPGPSTSRPPFACWGGCDATFPSEAAIVMHLEVGHCRGASEILASNLYEVAAHTEICHEVIDGRYLRDLTLRKDLATKYKGNAYPFICPNEECSLPFRKLHGLFKHAEEEKCGMTNASKAIMDELKQALVEWCSNASH